MDKIEKALKKLTKKERKSVKKILEMIETEHFQGLNVKKLKRRDDIFRARKGALRIIYRKNSTNKVFVLAIERRSEKTYKHF